MKGHLGKETAAMEDLAIIELYFNRDQRAISETSDKYGKLCRKIAKRITSDEHDAEECVNDTYYGVWNAIPPERPNSLAAFVAKIARNIAIGKLKYNMAAKRNSDAAVSLNELEEIIPDTSHFDEFEDREVGQWISDFLRGEDDVVRNIFIRKYWYFDSLAELSKEYGFSEGKIKSLLFRTRNKLREYLEKKGVTV